MVENGMDQNSPSTDCYPPGDDEAKLKAAAPDLLTHLKHMIWLVETEFGIEGGHIVRGAKAAVAKAIDG